METLDNIREQMGNPSREMQILRKNQREMLEVKTSVTETENMFDGLTDAPDKSEERTQELDDKTIETSNRKKQRERRMKKIRIGYSKNRETIQNCFHKYYQTIGRRR